jgi:hypothetical protein
MDLAYSFLRQKVKLDITKGSINQSKTGNNWDIPELLLPWKSPNFSEK